MGLSWNAASDLGTFQNQLKYKVVTASTTAELSTIENAEAATVVTDWTSNLTMANIIGLTPNTTYAFAVIVKDGVGNKSLYTALSATTLSNTFTVTYNGNGNTSGNVPTDSGAYTNGSTVTVLGNTGALVKAGYTFSSWNTVANGSGTSYSPSSTFVIGASSVNLYAQWAIAGSSDADLLSMTLSSGSLSPSFNSSITSYSSSVNNGVTSITVTPTVHEAHATVTVNGVSSSTPVQLSVGANVITVLVTAQAGNTNTYLITITRNVAGEPPVRPKGTLGTFTLLSSTLPGTFDSSSSVQVGSTLYLIGGKFNGAATTSICNATIDANGNIGSFTLSSYHLNRARYGARAEVIGDYIYIFGGVDGIGMNSIEYAPINNSGLTANFSAVTGTTLSTGRYNFLTVVTAKDSSHVYVYAMGGNYPELNTIESATIDTTTGAFTANFLTTGKTLVRGRWTHAGFRLGNNLYILGGEGTNTTEVAVVNSDGTLGDFAASGNMSSSRNRLSVIALNGMLYVFGGWNGVFLTSVDTAPINTSTNLLGSFTISNTVTLSAGVENGTPLLTDTAVFLFGGSSGAARNYIQRALINPLP